MKPHVIATGILFSIVVVCVFTAAAQQPHQEHAPPAAKPKKEGKSDSPKRDQRDPHAHHDQSQPMIEAKKAAQHEGHARGPGQAGMGEHHHAMPNMTGNHMEMDHSSMNSAGMFLMGQSSGTAFQPAAWPMPMMMTGVGNWRLMWMGQAYWIAAQQSGRRGGDKVYSSNWGMLGAVHPLGRGSVMLRSMVSLDPVNNHKPSAPFASRSSTPK